MALLPHEAQDQQYTESTSDCRYCYTSGAGFGGISSCGGLYGQSNYAVSRGRTHNRDAACSMHLYLRLAGCVAPCLSAVDGW